MNAPGTPARPETIGAALALVKQGGDVDYQGAYASIDWDAAGDVKGQIPFTIFRLDAQARRWDASQQILIPIPK